MGDGTKYIGGEMRLREKVYGFYIFFVGLKSREVRFTLL